VAPELTSSSIDLLLAVERDAGGLRRQVEDGLREAIRAGSLVPGARLPSTRGLAAELGVSRGVVVEAYGQLAAEGWLSVRSGAAARVAAVTAPAAPAAPARREPAARWDLRPGVPDLSAFPRAAWLAAARRALRALPDAGLGYGDPRGAPALRAALAAYLGRARGAVAAPERMVISSGFTQGLGLVCEVLRAGGATRLGMEDPSHRDERRLVRRAGLEPVPVPVDERGIVVDALAAADPDAVLVTPAHQFPTGAVLAPERRTALLEWAERRDQLIVEDDYDAEYRYDRAPVGSLQGLEPERVAYCGSVSKTLAPAIRLGWLVLPGRLVEPVAAAKALADQGSPVVGQLVLADLLDRGDLDRHLRRTRLRYRRRRDALLDALARRLPSMRAQGIAAGLHVAVRLPDDVDEAELIAAAARRGLLVGGMAEHRVVPGPPALLLGYARSPEPALRAAVSALAEVVETLPEGR
jgi:GntR family transcriptional regulator/MocR family aminotransferase